MANGDEDVRKAKERTRTRQVIDISGDVGRVSGDIVGRDLHKTTDDDRSKDDGHGGPRMNWDMDKEEGNTE